MSRLDQAFIKAYRKHSRPAQSEAPPPREPIAIPDTPQPMSWPPHGPVGYVPPSPHAPHAAIPAPHIRMGSTPITSTPPSATTTQEPLPTEPLQVATPLKPLQAAFEVPRFTWPTMVEQMTASAAMDFSVLAKLLQQHPRDEHPSLLISGCHRGEGRSTVTLAIARLMAAHGLRVAIIDADFTHPQLAEWLDLAIETGWEAVLAGQQPLSEALVESTEERLTLLPLRSPAHAGTAQIYHEKVQQTLAELRRAHDLLLIDAGPIDHDTAAVEFASLLSNARVDETLVVRDASRTTSEDLRVLGRRLASIGITQWNVVDNFGERD